MAAPASTASRKSATDEAAISSVRLASPFAPFTAEMKDKIDILEIIRTWQFNASELVTSQ